MDNGILKYRIALSLLPGLNSSTADRISDAGMTEADVFSATEAELRSLPGFPRQAVSAQVRYKALDEGTKEEEYLQGKKIRALWYKEPGYPRRLLDSDAGPLLIYATGDCDLNSRPSVSIVGTRHATSYGTAVTERLVAELAEIRPDTVIVSGLAYGIDVAAHKAALRAGLTTVGVVAHGLATLYPAIHRDIAARMIEAGGAIMTEYTHEISPLRPNFLARNRLVALLGDALVVAESAERGGALSTARHARRAARQVFAAPGRLTDMYSAGCNDLIANGAARMLGSAAEMAEILGWQTTVPARQEEEADEMPDLTDDEVAILRVIQYDASADNDTISAATGLPAHIVMSTIIGLEMKEIIYSTSANRYQLNIAIDLTKYLKLQ